MNLGKIKNPEVDIYKRYIIDGRIIMATKVGLFLLIFEMVRNSKTKDISCRKDIIENVR